MTISLPISLGPDGLAVQLPSGRKINVGATGAGARFIQKMLRDAEAYEGDAQKGYIGAWPTQAIATLAERRMSSVSEAEVEEVKARKAEKAAADFEAKWKAKGIDSSAIKISI